MKRTTTYQLDSISSSKTDTTSDGNELELLLIEDESALIIPKKKNKRINKIQNEPIDEMLDTGFLKKDFKKIPTRKINAKTKHNTTIEEKLVDFEPNLNQSINTTWQTVLLVAICGLLGFIKAFNTSRFNQVFKSLFSYHASEEILREDKVLFHRVNVGLFFMYVLNLALFVEAVHIFHPTQLTVKYTYLINLLLVVVAYFVKFISNTLLLSVFSKKELIAPYIYSTLIYNYLFGLILLPSLAFIYYSNISFELVFNYIVIPALIVIFLLRIFRLFIIGVQNNFFILYIILYICTLEILPLVVLSKIFILK